ncbi:MAG TPA: FMN-binding protein [Chloroflexi bacterium]|jgi:uncharacterized protein with FMN-binding domain|nr:FMN-binding protein [Chloroflexota bacterium]HAL28389.1 FMN-binding protein [Chloroflexota bacterium]
MTRVTAALTATVAGLILIATFKVSPEDAAGLEPTPSASAGAGRLTGPTPSTGRPASSGTVTGDSVQTIFGNVQVAITVSGTKLVDVQALTLPSDRSRSARISDYAGPMLRSEAIQAQSAQIHVVSGATYTSRAYSQSLASALKKAHLG